MSGLTATDLSLTDNGTPRDIAFFGVKERPVDILFALDNSGSIRDVIAQQQAAALGLLQRFIDARIALLRFGRESRLTVPFTADQETLRPEFARRTRGDTRTAIFDAALASVRALAVLGSNRTERRRIVILISDGLDTASTVKPQSVIDAAQQADISFYVIHLPLYTVRGNSVVTRPVAKGFKELASKTGGLYLNGPKADTALSPFAALDLGPIFQAISEDVNGRYELAFYLEPGADRSVPHHLEVKYISNKRNDLRVKVLRTDFTLDAGDNSIRPAQTNSDHDKTN